MRSGRYRAGLQTCRIASMHSSHLLPLKANYRGLTGMAFHFTENRAIRGAHNVLISEVITAPLWHEVQASLIRRACAVSSHLCEVFPTVIAGLRYVVHWIFVNIPQMAECLHTLAMIQQTESPEIGDKALSSQRMALEVRKNVHVARRKLNQFPPACNACTALKFTS